MLTSPENTSTLIAFATAVGCETVIVRPLVSAVVTGAEHTTVRTPVVVEPFVTSASFVYVFGVGDALSEHVTVPDCGSIANVTMIVLPVLIESLKDKDAQIRRGAAIGAGCRDLSSIGQRLKAGTNCGSCLPELLRLIRNAAAVSA